MAKYRSITISGPVASGTTTAARDISEKLEIDYKSAGDFFRQYMPEHKIPLHKKEDIPDEVDRKVDQQMTDLLASKKPIVIDGLYFGYFCKTMTHVLRVLLTANEEVRIKRALDRTHTHKETPETIRARDRTHDIKFRKLYADENFLDPKFFDLVIDTSNKSREEVSEEILEKFNQ